MAAFGLGAVQLAAQENAAAPDNRLALGRPHGRGERERLLHPSDQAVGAMEPGPPLADRHPDSPTTRGVICAQSRSARASRCDGVPVHRGAGHRLRVDVASRAHHSCGWCWGGKFFLLLSLSPLPLSSPAKAGNPLTEPRFRHGTSFRDRGGAYRTPVFASFSQGLALKMALCRYHRNASGRALATVPQC
jgi:hypothetical protein